MSANVQGQTAVRCACGLNHFVQKNCRKCELPLPVAAVTNVLFLREMDPLPTVEDFEAMLIVEALSRTEGNVVSAANSIGMGKTTMFRKMKLLGIPTRRSC